MVQKVGGLSVNQSNQMNYTLKPANWNTGKLENL